MSPNFQRAAFISYRNGGYEAGEPIDDLLNSFATKLFEQLNSELRTYTPYSPPVFLDMKESTYPGKYVLDFFSQGLCRSLCMILVYTPNYFSRFKRFCASECYGMLEREQYFRDKLGKKAECIIPVILRGEESEVPEFLRERFYCNLSRFGLRKDPNKFSGKDRKAIAQIAAHIGNLYRLMESEELDLCEECHSFSIPNPKKRNKDMTDFINNIGAYKVADFPLTGA